MQAIETEVKIRVLDRTSFEQKLPALGFSCVTARTLERNTLYDTPERALRQSRQILRIREYGPRWVVTHKSVPSGLADDGRHKQRVETETQVADGPVMAQVFAALGYRPVFVYEKWRTEWDHTDGHCVLDETPLGLYAELEGPIEWIDTTAAKLGIGEDEYITLSYGRIFENWRNTEGSSAKNFTFAEIPENFPKRRPGIDRRKTADPSPSLGMTKLRVATFPDHLCPGKVATLSFVIPSEGEGSAVFLWSRDLAFLPVALLIFFAGTAGA